MKNTRDLDELDVFANFKRKESFESNKYTGTFDADSLLDVRNFDEEDPKPANRKSLLKEKNKTSYKRGKRQRTQISDCDDFKTPENIQEFPNGSPNCVDDYFEECQDKSSDRYHPEAVHRMLPDEFLILTPLDKRRRHELRKQNKKIKKKKKKYHQVNFSISSKTGNIRLVSLPFEKGLFVSWIDEGFRCQKVDNVQDLCVGSKLMSVCGVDVSKASGDRIYRAFKRASEFFNLIFTPPTNEVREYLEADRLKSSPKRNQSENVRSSALKEDPAEEKVKKLGKAGLDDHNMLMQERLDIANFKKNHKHKKKRRKSEIKSSQESISRRKRPWDSKVSEIFNELEEDSLFTKERAHKRRRKSNS